LCFSTLTPGQRRFSYYAWGVLAWLLLVILWGAFVRATSSGAGCGSHWPLCNGVVLPRSPAAETLIELSHRLTSALAGLLVIGLLAWAFRAFPKGHRVRKGAAWTMAFILTEGLIGAVIVLFEWVAQDASMARVLSMVLHLCNTYTLVAALTLTAWWAAGGPPVRIRGQGRRSLLLGTLVALLLGVAMLGAVTALGDTLFRATSHAEGFAQTFSDTSHLAVRLRVLHPVLAILTGAVLFWCVRVLGAGNAADAPVRRLGGLLEILYLGQVALGVVNVYLLAPVWMQLLHLLLADVLWIFFVLFAATVLAAPPPDVP
jgi:heme A synthase